MPSKKNIFKQRGWLFFLFPFLFVADMLYGVMHYYRIELPVSPGELFRGFALLLSVIMVLRYIRLLERTIILWYFLMLLSGLPGIIIGIHEDGSFIQDISMLLRILYAPSVILLMLVLIRRYSIKGDYIFRFIEISAYVLGLSLLFSQSFGVQRETYGSYAIGSTGIFYAQNDLTLAVGISVLAASYHLIYSFSFIRMILIGLSLFACVNIGTRASLAVVSGCSLVIFILVIWGDHPEKKLRALRRIRVITVGFMSILVMSAILVYGVTLQQKTSFQQEKIRQIAQGNLPRSILIEAADSHLSSRPWFYRFTGEGISSFTRGVARYYGGIADNKLTEVDHIDLFGAHGFIFPFLIYGLYLFIFIRCAKRFVREDKLPQAGLISAALIMYIGHSVFAGHAVTSPIVSTLIAGYVGSGLNLEKKQL